MQNSTSMNIRNSIAPFFAAGIVCICLGCETKKQSEATSFTRIDSLTDIYLTLQDSLYTTWNLMIKDDNQKIKAMKNLLHELEVGAQYSKEEIKSIEQRIAQLTRIRYTPKTMWNADVIEEYDFASNSLVSELIALAESHSAFSYNNIMQNLVEEIRASDMRVETYRMEYDALAMRYNEFLDENKDLLREIANNGSIDKKPLFQMVSE